MNQQILVINHDHGVTTMDAIRIVITRRLIDDFRRNVGLLDTIPIVKNEVVIECQDGDKSRRVVLTFEDFLQRVFEEHHSCAGTI